MFIVTLFPIVSLKFFIKLPKKWWIYLPLVIIFIYSLFAIPTYSIKIAKNMGWGSKMILYCEATRMSMKIYSYLRTKLLYGT